MQSARALDALIQQVQKDYRNPDLKVDVIAHSMGGMIVRYFVRYGTSDVLDSNELPVSQYGADRIRRVVLLGTPNLGSIGALRTLIEGYRVGLKSIPPEVVLTFPSTYQVLPHALNNWFVTMGGDCIPTPARAVVEEYGADSERRLEPSEIRKPLPGVDYERMMLEPGDGTVTKASLLARQSFDPAVARHEHSFIAVDYPIFLCEAHSQLTGNIDFQNNLLHALLNVDR